MEDFKKLKWSWKTARCDESNLKFFDATFLDHKDAFYAHLNEINPIHESDIGDMTEQSTSGTTFVYVDPRNGLSVKKAVVSERDHYLSLFKFFPCKSSLTPMEHDDYLKVLMGNSSTEVLEMYEGLKSRIEDENKRYQDFVKGYFCSNNMYRKKEVNPHLFALFVGKWKDEIEQFRLQETEMMSYNYVLATAIPLKCDKSQISNCIDVKITDIFTSKTSLGRIFPHEIIKNRIKGLTFHLEKYYNDLGSQKARTDTLCPDDQSVDVSIPVTSFLYLMQGYCEESEEWILPLTITEENGRKVIKFDITLPRTKIGSISRNNLIALHVLKAIFVQQTEFQEKTAPQEMENTMTNPYQVKTFDQYLEDYERKKKLTVQNESEVIRNVIEIKSDESCLTFMVSCVPDALENGKFVILSPKIEYQPEFGEEQMTQSELIREWIHLKFINNTLVKRVRMHFANYTVLSVRNITLTMVKDEFRRLYQLEETELLTSLYQVISMLKGFPTAQYLTRHDPTKKERVLIYQQHDQQISENASSHLDLQKIFSDVNFKGNTLDELQWTPIDLEGVADIHLQSRVAPGLFPYFGKHFCRPIKEYQKKRPNIPVKTKNDSVGNIKKKKKGKRKRNKKKEQMIKKLATTEESCDPTQLFDESGNVNIMNLLQGSPEKTEKKSFQRQKTLKSDPTHKRILRNREISLQDANPVV